MKQSWLLALLCLFIYPCFGQIYKVIDQNGNVSFSDQPQPNSKKIILDIPLNEVPLQPIDEKKLKAAQQKKAEEIERLNQQKQALYKQVDKAKQSVKRAHQQYNKCISGRRVAITDTSACVELQGEKKTACIKAQPTSYRLTSPEVCTPNYLQAAKDFIEKANKDLAKIDEEIKSLKRR